jgi:hypothetical protein
MPSKTNNPATVLVRVTPQTRTKLKVAASQQNLSIGKFIQWLMDQSLNEI